MEAQQLKSRENCLIQRARKKKNTILLDPNVGRGGMGVQRQVELPMHGLTTRQRVGKGERSLNP